MNLYSLAAVLQYSWGVSSLAELGARWMAANLYWFSGMVSPLSSLLFFSVRYLSHAALVSGPRRWSTNLTAVIGTVFLALEVLNILGLFLAFVVRNDTEYSLPALPFPPVCLLLGASLIAQAGKSTPF